MSDDQAIRELIDTWCRASMKGDVDTVATLMAEDVVFLTPGNPPIRGRDTFVDGFRGAFGQFSLDIRSDIQEVGVAGDMAYAWNVLTVTMTPRGGGEAVRNSGPVLSMFRKGRDGRWVLVRDANMLTGGA